MGKEIVERVEMREKAGDANAFYEHACLYQTGIGAQKDTAKALELWHRAGELGHAEAYHNISVLYQAKVGEQKDMRKAIHYSELAAIRGDSWARYDLGLLEKKDGNTERALKHFMIALSFGHNKALKGVRDLFMDGHATKEDYTRALRAHQAYLDEVKSVQRDKAALVLGYEYH